MKLRGERDDGLFDALLVVLGCFEGGTGGGGTSGEEFVRRR